MTEGEGVSVGEGGEGGEGREGGGTGTASVTYLGEEEDIFIGGARWEVKKVKVFIRKI